MNEHLTFRQAAELALIIGLASLAVAVISGVLAAQAGGTTPLRSAREILPQERLPSLQDHQIRPRLASSASVSTWNNNGVCEFELGRLHKLARGGYE